MNPARACLGVFLLALVASPLAAVKDLRTKEQRLYDIKLRKARWEVESRKLEMDNDKSEYDIIQELYEEKIETLESLNKARRVFLQSELKYNEAVFQLDRTLPGIGQGLA